MVPSANMLHRASFIKRFVRGFHARPAAAAERRRTAERVRAERKFDNTVAKVREQFTKEIGRAREKCERRVKAA
ncbi:hypothetical protein C2E20_2177 [Micractinium conductrix]|uniref:Uncharacterized protein n=1 Tax=Micractinium conductrix TaxID=554055 RepID=A0A2P6VKN9_9CHLO|nr:hypothetical protein C2E20_2177 [Micractinium conductrix]|eukprot:PSC74645.1 hypothetical protein C2E20_2177 [Micractinium conductrix]